MTAVTLGQQGSQTVGLGSSLCRAECFFLILLTFVRKSNGSHERTTGFCTGWYGFESQALPNFFNFNITTENRDTAPLLSLTSFDT